MGTSKVPGLNTFRRYMEGLEGSYAVIGGVACDILLSSSDLPFRATRDFDTVLIADARLPETAKAIWDMVRDGGYRCGWGQSDNVCFYRFTEPTRHEYPQMIELFSKRPAYMNAAEGVEVSRLYIDDEVSSLSAILLNDDYYSLMIDGIQTIAGISVLAETHLIPFKARAYLDLSSRKTQGERIDAKKVRKHLRDALRLTQLLTGEEKVELPQSIASDMRAFIDACADSDINLKQIGVSGTTMKEIVYTLKQTYGL